MLAITSGWPYFVLMPFYIVVGFVLVKLLRFDMAKVSPKIHVPLESIRGLLALNVVFCHSIVTYYWFKTGVWTTVAPRFYLLLGTASVILFFYLSSYLLWSKCLLNKGVGGYGRYLKTRARRIIPAYYASVAIMLAVVAARSHFMLRVPGPVLAKQILCWLAFSIGGLPLVNGVVEAPYINAGIFWTLQFEVVFYLALPLLYLLFKGSRIFLFVVPLAAVYWNMARHGVHFMAEGQSADGASILAFALATFFGFGFGGGMLIAYLNANGSPAWKSVLKRRWMGVIPLACIFVPYFLKVVPYSATHFLFTAVVFLFLIAGNDLFGLLSSPALFLLGSVSYSLYVTHGIVLFVLSRTINHWMPFEQLSPLAFWGFVAVAGVVAICVATMLHFRVELPFISRSSALAMPAKEPVRVEESSAEPVLQTAR